MKNKLYIVSIISILIIFGLNGVCFAAEQLTGDQINLFVDKTNKSIHKDKFSKELGLFHYYLGKYHASGSTRSFEIAGVSKTSEDVESVKQRVTETAHTIDASLAKYLEDVNIEEKAAISPLSELRRAIEKSPSSMMSRHMEILGGRDSSGR